MVVSCVCTTTRWMVNESASNCLLRIQHNLFFTCISVCGSGTTTSQFKLSCHSSHFCLGHESIRKFSSYRLFVVAGCDCCSIELSCPVLFACSSEVSHTHALSVHTMWMRQHRATPVICIGSSCTHLHHMLNRFMLFTTRNSVVYCLFMPVCSFLRTFIISD